MKNGTILAVIALGAVAAWALATGKIKLPGVKAAATTSSVPTPAVQPTTEPPSPWATVPTSISLLPTFVTYGGGTYQPVAGNPVPVGDTGFKVWGATPEGYPIVSMNPPDSYEAWEWM